MKSARKANEVKVRTKKSTQDDLTMSAKSDENVKKNAYSVSTPRNYIPKSSTADIYARKKPALTPRKMVSLAQNKESPMKGFLKSTPSTSQISSKKVKQKTADLRTNQTIPSIQSATRSVPGKLIHSSVTVNSPVAKRRLNLEAAKESVGKKESEKKEASFTKDPPKDPWPGRQRTKTRTLEDDEVKILTPEAIDNNAAMQDLTRKLTAKAKAFYVDLEEKTTSSKINVAKQNSKSSEEDDVSYEDDFESYESDFDSYHSETQSDETSAPSDGTSGEESDQMNKLGDSGEELNDEINSKESKEEEKMLDSGNFELRDSQRSASRKPAVMDFILEGSEDTTDDKKVSLTDEGFQEMSSSSAVSSMRIVHTDVLERPLFIDFTKSKENKRKRKILEKLKQRANDILSMVTLHSMSYSLFEIKPIPYDLYMATFGRKNYTQTAVQTFEDGITQEVQTDDVSYYNKWTQFPVEFSNNDIVVDKDIVDKNNIQNLSLNIFDNLINQDGGDKNITISEEYKRNPLKIFLEQKDGAGGNKIMPEEIYKSKLKKYDYNTNKLKKFLKKSERRISSILSLNTGSSETLNSIKKSKLPFSKGYLNISTKNVTDNNLSFLKHTKTIGIAISETKENLIMTYQKNSLHKQTIPICFICLWDINVVRYEPLKVLKASNSVVIGRYKGNTNGVFVAALEDRSLHIWDLSEKPTWCNDVATSDVNGPTKLVKLNKNEMSQIEIDREWNLKNSQVSYDAKFHNVMQISGYTSSATGMNCKNSGDNIVALEFLGDHKGTSENGGRKIMGQICTLQRLGIVTTWSIIQEKCNTHDIGKAYWSKTKLEKKQTVHLSEHLDVPIYDTDDSFNLNAAKRRLLNRKQERIERRKDLSRPKSAILRNIDRPSSNSSPRKNVSNITNINGWDSKLICNHLKVLRLNNIDNYLVASSNGEVLCCKRNLKDFKVDRLCVACDKSSITRLEVTHSNLSYFLAATHSGTINLCSILDARVLLTLDCRNGPPTTTVRCQADHKGRFIASVPEQAPTETGSRYSSNLSIRCLSWSPTNPFCIAAVLTTGAVVTWELTHSDINPKSVVECAAVAVTSSGCSSMALLTREGEVQIHRLLRENDESRSIELFKKYVTLL